MGVAVATVTVRGQAYGDVEPDRVRLQIGVQAEAATAAEAFALLGPRSAAVDRALGEAGDLVLLRRAGAVRVHQLWSPSGTAAGYAARRSVGVEARTGGRLGELLSALVAVPGTAVDGTEWVVDPGNPAHSRLRSAAVGDARTRATDYAAAAGLRLGALESITEPGLAGPPGVFAEAVPMAARMAEDGGGGGGPVLELRPEPVPVSASVDIRYALLAGPAAGG